MSRMVLKEDIGALISTYIENKRIMDASKKKCEEVKDTIKEYLQRQEGMKCDSNGTLLYLKEKHKETLNEDLAIEKIKEFYGSDKKSIKKFVATKEILNEEAIKNGKFDGSFNVDLSGCINEVVSYDLMMK